MQLIRGTLFLVLYMALMYIIGAGFTKKEGAYTRHFVIGYLIFSCFVGLGGVPIQILNLPWIIFAMYLLAVIVGLLVCSLLRLRAARIPLIDAGEMRVFFRSQWFVLVVALVLSYAMLANITYIWGNNSSDDGYYLSLVATLPYSPNNFYTNPASGLSSNLKHMASYLVNTIYTEYSVYVRLFGFKTTTFCRMYMSFFNYFLFGCCITTVAEMAMKNIGKVIRPHMYQFSCLILLLFGFPAVFLQNNHIFYVYDDWQFNTAMYYGSSIIRCLEIFLIVIPLMKEEELNSKHIMWLVGIAIALMSKSSIALPLLILVPIAYVISHFIFSGHFIKILLAGVTLFLFMALSIVMPQMDSAQKLITDYFSICLQSFLLLPSLLLFASSFLYQKKEVYRLNVMMILLFVFMMVPPFRKLFYIVSTVDFVAGRAVTTWIYTYLVLCTIYLLIDLYLFVRTKKYRTLIPITLSACLTIFMFSRVGSLHDLGTFYTVIHANPQLIPNSTVELGEVMEQRYQETGVINRALVNEGAKPNDILHFPAGIIRTQTPHTVCLSAAVRFTAGVDGSFGQEQQNAYYHFMVNPVEDTYAPFAQVCDTFDINTVVMQSDVGANSLEYQEYMDRIHFNLYDIVLDDDANVQYYVYVRDHA